jgi:hypothetical protein
MIRFVRLGSLRHLVLSSVVAAALGLLIASSASAVTASRRVALNVKIAGSGTIYVTGSRSFTCHSSQTKPGGTVCYHTFYVRRGRRIVVKALPLSGWKRTTWAGACKGSAATCSLRLNARRFLAVRFVPPGSAANPVRLGTPVFMPGNGWRIQVNSVTRDADAQIEAVTDQHGDPVNRPPPSGFHYALVNMTVNNPGLGAYADGSANRDGGIGMELVAGGAYWGIGTPGAHWCQSPPLDLSSGYQVPSGGTVTGDLCFLVAAQALQGSWMLTTFDDMMNPGQYWFDLG